jgi:hypothetical protein
MYKLIARVHTLPYSAYNTHASRRHDFQIFHLIPISSLGRILLRPFPADSLCVLLILLVMLGDIGSKWVVRIGRTQ